MVVGENEFGKGKAYYLGTDLENEVLKVLFEHLCQDAQIQKNPLQSRPKVEVIHRVLDGEDYYYVFNFTAQDTEVDVEVPVYDYLNLCTYEKKIPLEQNGFAVVKRCQRT